MDRTAGGQRHPADAGLRLLQHGRPMAQTGHRSQEVRHRHCAEPDLLFVAQAHRRVLRGENAAGRRFGPRWSVPQRPRRAYHARACQDPGVDRPSQCQRAARGVPHSLCHRTGATLLFRGHQTWHEMRQHRRSAAGRRSLQSVHPQCHCQCPGHRHYARGERSAAGKDGEAFHYHRRARGVSDRSSACLRPHPIPPSGAGRMISNFRYHLSKVGMADRLQAVLEETARVREDFGHPIMVTPYSQFVGTQAALNVIAGERYKIISDEVILYALGFWGEEESTSMDPNIRDRIVSSPRAKELAKWELPQPSLNEVRQRYGGPGVSDDELLLRLSADKESVDSLRAAGPSKPLNGEPSALLRLVEQLNRSKGCRQIRIQKEGLSVTLHRSEERP